MRFACSLVLVVSVYAAGPACAQEASTDTRGFRLPPSREALRRTAVALAEAGQVEEDQEAPAAVPARRTRPASLIPMYVTFGALQALDFQSTRRALDNGSGREANGIMRRIAEHPAAFLAVKAGATAATIFATERIWKKNRVGAIVFIAVANSAMAAVVAHNYSVARPK